MKMHLSGSRARRGKKSRSSQLNDRNLGRVVQRILEIEALETRLLLSGVGNGLHKKKVTFTDADGDKVTVQLTGPSSAYFDIMLQGAATNNADIESILIHGGTAKSAFSITDKPVRFTHAATGVYAGMFSNAVVSVGEIDATGTTALKGVALSGVIPTNINLPGVAVGSIGLNPGMAPTVDQINTAVVIPIGPYIPQTPFVDYHTVTAGSIGTLTLNGVGGQGENFIGPITATGSIGSIVGLNSTLNSTVSALSINRIQVLGAGGADISTTTGNLTLDVGNGGIGVPASVVVGGDLNLSVSGGGLSGTFIAGGHINLGVGGGGIANGSVLQAGNGISGPGSSTTDLIQITGNTTLGVGSATFHALGGNIASITVTGTTAGMVGTQIIADTGNIGTLTADNFNGVYVNAQMGSIGGVTAHSATAAAISGGSVFHAGTTIGPITATSDLQGSQAITGSTFSADTGFTGAITATVTGGTGATAILNSTFRTGGDFAGAITATASNTGGTTTNNAISSSTFSARGSFLGGISVPQGNINNTKFLAGYDIGPNLTIDGTFTATSDDRVGDPTASPTFTSITVGNGNVIGSIFASGVTPGTDATFGNANDNLNATGATIGAYNVTGSTTGSVFESATIFPLSFSQVFTGNTVRAFTGNIGDITINGSFPNMTAFGGNTITADLGSIGNVFVRNSSPIGLDAIGLSGATGNTLTAKLGVGDIIGITDGTGSGINGLTVVGDSSGRGLGSVGSIIGVATNAGEPSLDGILNLTASGAHVGTTLSAAATAFLSANLSAATNTAVTALLGTGGVVGYTVGTGGLTPVSIYGISGSTVNALTAIGNIGASAISTTATGSHYGIFNSTFRAGANSGGTMIGIGTIGNVNATATATGAAAAAITADALNSAHFAAGGNAAGASSIGTITANATALTTAGTATADGIDNGSYIKVGLGTGGNGTIGVITVNATATASSTATAYGIAGTTIQASDSDQGVGVIGDSTTKVAITSTAIATSTAGGASAYGIHAATIKAGNGGGTGTGTIWDVTGTGTATGAATGGGRGITGGTVIYAGNGASGAGTIGNVTGTGSAIITGASGLTATADGLRVDVEAIGATGTIGNVTGSGTAQATSSGTSVTATATAYGIHSSTFAAGALGSGTIGTISGTGGATASAPAGTAVANAYGIDPTTVTAGGGKGVGVTGSIAVTGGITGTGTATASGATGTTTVNVYGINGLTISAGSAGTGAGTAGTVGAITGTANTTLTAGTNTASSTAGSATVTADGIKTLGVTAGNAAVATSTGTIGLVTGTAGSSAAPVIASAPAGTATTTVAGASGVTLVAEGGTGTLGNGTDALIGTAFGTATGGSAHVANSYGLASPTLTVANGLTGDTATIGNITGSATLAATATGAAGTGDAYVGSAGTATGLSNLTLNAGNTGASTATVGNLTGNIDVRVTNTGTAVADTAQAYGFGFNVATVNVGRNGTGTVGNITGEVTNLNASSAAIDTLAGLASGDLALAQGAGIEAVTVRAGDNAATATGTIGSIAGKIDNSTVIATGGKADAWMWGLNGSFSAGPTAAGTGTTTGKIAAGGSITGSITATVTGLSAVNGNGIGTNDAINGLTINAAAGAKTGIVGDIIGTASIATHATGTGQTLDAGHALFTPTATTLVNGINGLAVTVAGGTAASASGTVGKIQGLVTTASAIADGTLAGAQTNAANVTARGITNDAAAVTVSVGTNTNGAGTVGLIDGEVTVTSKADATVAGSTANANAIGLNPITVTVGNGTGVGNASGVTGKATLTVASKTAGAIAGNGMNTVAVTANTGTVGDVTGSITGSNGLTAITGSNFLGKTIGAITATANQTADNAVLNSNFKAVAGITSITATGGLSGAHFLVGFTDMTFAAAAAGGSIGNVTVHGALTTGTAIIASVTPGAYYGANADAAVGTSATIGVVTIDLPLAVIGDRGAGAQQGALANFGGVIEVGGHVATGKFTCGVTDMLAANTAGDYNIDQDTDGYGPENGDLRIRVF